MDHSDYKRRSAGPAAAVQYWARALIALATLVACDSSKSAVGAPGRRGPSEFPVEVMRLAPERIDYSVQALGAVEAFEQVQVTARVAGGIDRVNFREGEHVPKGALLAEIDPDRYGLAVARLEAALEQTRTTRAEAARELERFQKLSQEGVATQLDVGSWETKLQMSVAAEAQVQADLNGARLNLRDARVRAPVSGTIETRSVQTGQYVQPGSVLATILQREPLLLRFKVKESEASQIKPGMLAEFQLKDELTTYRAKITLVAGSAEATTRLVPIVAEVDASAQNIRPGSFAEVTVPLSHTDEALAIPETAVRSSEHGFLGYVVEGSEARQRVLTLGLRTSDGRVQVQQGLEAGELLVVRGAEALAPGSKVRVVTPAPLGLEPSAPSPSATPPAANAPPPAAERPPPGPERAAPSLQK